MKRGLRALVGLVFVGLSLGCDQKKPAELVTSKIKVRKEEGRQAHGLDAVNDAGVSLTECRLTFTVFRENGSNAEVKRYWDRWAPGETKTMGLPPEGRIERVDVAGTAFFPEVNMPGRVSASFTFPAAPPGPAKPKVNAFTARRDEGLLSHGLIYKYTGAAKLVDVDVTLTVSFDRGAKPVVKRFYATWLPGEEKTVTVSAADGVVQKHEFTGTAKRDGAEVAIEAFFSKKAPGE